jgi:peptidoglycan-associated lipoprotein
MVVASGPVPGSAEDFRANIKDRVFFQFDRSNISAESRNTLEAQAGWLKAYPNTTGVVEGHCDSRGTREYNLALGKRRAVSAQSELSSMGVGSDRMKTVSYGKDRPIVSGDTEEAYAQNRVAITAIN